MRSRGEVQQRLSRRLSVDDVRAAYTTGVAVAYIRGCTHCRAQLYSYLYGRTKEGGRRRTRIGKGLTL